MGYTQSNSRGDEFAAVRAKVCPGEIRSQGEEIDEKGAEGSE